MNQQPENQLQRPYGAGPAVSAFSLGTMRALGSPAQMEAVLRAALAAGINHLETAPAYGPAETFLGQALAALQRDNLAPEAGWRITSKLLPGPDLATGQGQLRSILERLGVAQLTNLAVHGLNRPEHLEWALKGPGADLLAWAKDEGLVGRRGDRPCRPGRWQARRFPWPGRRWRWAGGSGQTGAHAGCRT